MANRIINTDAMMDNINKYVKKIIAKPRSIVDAIKVDTIASAKQKLKQY